MITMPNGQYKKTKKGHCECIIGQDENSHQPHLIKCYRPAAYIWFWRQWFYEIIQGKEPIYSQIGAACCQECFDKISKDIGPPSDLEKYREIWKVKNEARNKG